MKDDTITQNTEETRMERLHNSTSHHEQSSTKNEIDKITTSTDHNHTLQEKQHNKSIKQEEKWIKVQNEIKQNTYGLE